jgi:glycosyltransferase involved in cell wall biosynthesis
VRRYLTGLTTALHRLDQSIQLTAIGADAATLPRGVAAVDARAWVPTNFGWSIDGLPRAARRVAFDVFHAPAYTAPLWGAHPLVLTIHDVSYQRHPEWYPYQGGLLRRLFYRRCALAADLIVTDSEFSRREIEAAYRIDSSRIRVVPLGVGPPFAPAPGRARGGSRAPMILHLGDLHARRNLLVLVDALAEMRRRANWAKRIELVLAGADRGSGQVIRARAAQLGVDQTLRFVDAADDATVVRLLHDASVLAYPSLYEGFGLPVLEAMACGTPVVASKAASIPEVIGDAGLTVAPREVGAWADALLAVLGSREGAELMREAGLARAATFTWAQTAALTLDAYRSVIRTP